MKSPRSAFCLLLEKIDKFPTPFSKIFYPGDTISANELCGAAADEEILIKTFPADSSLQLSDEANGNLFISVDGPLHAWLNDVKMSPGHQYRTKTFEPNILIIGNLEFSASIMIS